MGAARLSPTTGGSELMARPKRQPDRQLPVSSPRDLMRWLIPPAQALDLTRDGATADALANATRQIGDADRIGLGHLAPRDMLTALAELDLQAKKLPPDLVTRLDSTVADIRMAEIALENAKKEHRRAKAEVLFALGYHEEAETLGYRVALVETEASK
jgi:hypothetical protein